MEIPLLDFLLASLLMGIGIGTDVALATLARGNQLRHWKVAAMWVIGVTFTHTFFPMVGYITTYFGIQLMPMFTPLVGIVAASCIFWFLWNELFVSDETPNASDRQSLVVTLGLILAVSWDALWSGPAKSAQVIGWPELAVWASFLLVGAAVAVLAITSLFFCRLFQHKLTGNGSFVKAATWLQYSVVGYFGLLALLRYTLDLHIAWHQLMAISAVIIGCLMVWGHTLSLLSQNSTSSKAKGLD